jgi:phospholipid/cholesterol/gamma-HCH transport system substrate-binding protein
MIKNKLYIVVGTFVIGLSVLLLLFVFWLTSIKHSKTYVEYFVYIREDVSGLTKDTPVRFNGVPIGFVKSLKLNPKDLQQVILSLALEQGTPITTYTYATLVSKGITGLDFVGLKVSKSGGPLLQKKSGQSHYVIPYRPSLLVELSTAVRRVTLQVESLSSRLTGFLTAQNQQAFSSILAHMNHVTGSLSSEADELADTIHSAHGVVKRLDRLLVSLQPAAKTLNKSLHALGNSAGRVGEMAGQISLVARDARGTLSVIGGEITPRMNQLVTNLNGVALNMQVITGELRQNPAVILRGRTPRPLGPGEGGES